MTKRDTSNDARAGDSERRSDRRLRIQLPVECRSDASDSAPIVRAVTRDISSRGLFLEMDAPAFRLRDRLRLDMALPPAEGVSPYEGRASCTAEVLRAELIPGGDGGRADSLPRRYGIAARFLEPLRLSY